MKKLLILLVVAAMVAVTMVGLIGCNDKGKAEFKVGVLHINPTSSTSGYTYAHEQGIQYMQRELGLKDSQIIRKDSVDDTDSAAINNALEELVAAGCNIIFGTSFGYMEEMEEKAEQYPNVIFSHGTGYLSNETNFNNYFGRIYQARYLSGIVAGLKATEGGKLGYVVAHGTYIAECSSGVNAFALGVQAVNPTATVHVKELGTWWDPDLEASHAQALLDMGCEVIAQHCDTENPPIKAKDAGKYAIGYNSDMSKTEAGSSVLTSVVWNWGVYYKAAVQAAMDGNWTEFGNYYGDYADGLFDLAPYSSQCADGTEEAVNLVKAIFNDPNDTWDVFSGVKLSITKDGDTWTLERVNADLKDADDTVIVAAGGLSVPDSVITGNMPYWIAGVVHHA